MKENLVREYIRAERVAQRASELVKAVEQYVEPKPGTPYMHRSELLRIKNKLKVTL